MYQICFTINGVRHCFDIPILVDLDKFHRPPPNNMPELELAVTVIGLVDKLGHTTDLAKQLTEASTRYIANVQKQLPKGVEVMKHDVAAHAA